MGRLLAADQLPAATVSARQMATLLMLLPPDCCQLDPSLFQPACKALLDLNRP